MRKGKMVILITGVGVASLGLLKMLDASGALNVPECHLREVREAPAPADFYEYIHNKALTELDDIILELNDGDSYDPLAARYYLIKGEDLYNKRFDIDPG